jgi:uncharacterized membrane protein YhaH (DUF805 family)
MFTLFNGIALFVWAFVLALLSASVGNMDDLQTIQIVIQLSWMSLMGLPGLAVSVRRLHDLGKSGWMSLIALIPIVGAVWMLVLMVTEGQTGENRFGPDPKTSPETFPDRAKLTSVGVITIIGESVSAIGTLCMVLFPVLYFGVEYPMSFIVVAQYIIPP